MKPVLKKIGYLFRSFFLLDMIANKDALRKKAAPFKIAFLLNVIHVGKKDVLSIEERGIF